MKNKLFRAAASALLTLLLVVTLLPVRAHAAGATLTGTAAPQAGDTVTLTLSVPNKVYGLTADLSYSGNLSFTNYNCSVSGNELVILPSPLTSPVTTMVTVAELLTAVMPVPTRPDVTLALPL